jgi:hypothetical protein
MYILLTILRSFGSLCILLIRRKTMNAFIMVRLLVLMLFVLRSKIYGNNPRNFIIFFFYLDELGSLLCFHSELILKFWTL